MGVRGAKQSGRNMMTSQENTFWISQNKIRMSKTQIIKFKIVRLRYS